MSTTLGADEGLRARKKAATQAAIEKVAISLALERGYDHVTVEMICDEAMVSQRTFFNYFGSKEGVILGAAPPMPTEDAIQAFVNGAASNVLGDLVELMSAPLVDLVPDSKLLSSRRTLIMRTPELVAKQIARMTEFEETLGQLVLARLHANGRNEQTTPDLKDEALIIVSLASGAMHYAMRKWFRSDFAGTPHELLERSVELIRRVTL